METWKIGNVEITRVVDVVTPMPPTVLFPDATPESVAELPDWLRPRFIDAFQKMIDVGTRGGVERYSVRIRAPLIDLPKHEIIRHGLELGVDYALTVSCYDPDVQGLACGVCESCRIRRDAFAKLGIEDPVPYAA